MYSLLYRDGGSATDVHLRVIKNFNQTPDRKSNIRQVRIGAQAPAQVFSGTICCVRVFNKVLSMQEVSDLLSVGTNPDRKGGEFPLFADISVKLLDRLFEALRASPKWSDADGSGIVKSLNLNGIPLSKRAEEFIKLLRENKSLEALDIRNTDFPVESVKALLEVIINHPNLSVVAMPEGILSNEEHKMLGDILAKRCARMKGDVSSLVNLGRGIANIGLLQNEHFVRWDTMLKQSGDFGDEITRKLRLELFATFCSQPQIGNIATALQFDVSFIRRPGVIVLCESSVEFKSLIRTNLSDKAREIQKSCRALSRVSADILPAADRGILLSLNNLSTNLTQVATTLDVTGGDIAGVVLSEVIRNFEGVSTFTVDATRLTTTLFNHVSNISQLDKPLADLGLLRTELTGAFNALGPILDTAGVLSTVINQVISAGHAVSTIATSVTQIINGAVVLGPIGAIAGAIGAVFSVFGGGGPSNEELMIS